MSPKKFFSGNTLEQAVRQAARHFQLDPEQVAYEQVDRRHGFLKVRRRVVIGVDPESPAGSGSPAPERRPETAPARAEAALGAGELSAPRPARVAPGPDPRAGASDPMEPELAEDRTEGEEPEEAWSGVSPGDAAEAAQEALRRLFRLGRLDLEAEVSTNADGLKVELRGGDEDELFEDRGRLLMAIQHLLPRMIRGLTGGSVACQVDSDNFHEVRAEQLRVMAQDAAAEVRRSRRMQTLEPMSPDERRIVHLTLADDPAVETESHGTGLFKRVTVRPAHRPSRGSDDYRR